MTVTTEVVFVRAIDKIINVQGTSEVGVKITERTRPVVAVLTHAAPISTAAPTSSREEDTIAVDFTGYEITPVPALGFPSPLAVIAITEFFKLCFGWHTPSTAPMFTGGIVTTGWADTRLTYNLVVIPIVT